ncbi:isoprenylcysteine carboxylmethyltransferase family protein [Sphingomonas sp. PB2P12]|uniref:methyltransferase family protein n=1 Tax=Sphingomonas sandaracina TaxID=3096157 RepID=UPI002FC5D9FB
MDHDATLPDRARPDPRPRSAVSGGAGICGLLGIFTWLGIARWYGMDGPYSALVNVFACGLPMVVWSLAIDKVHRNDSTGIDWSARKPVRATLETSLTKLAGLWATWAAIAVIYGTVRSYWQGNFAFAMWCFTNAAPILFVASIPYVVWIDRYLIEPRDGAWHLGAWLTGQADVEHEAIYGHLRAWGVKTFFLAFMLAIVPPGFATFVRGDLGSVLHDPVALANWLITFMFLIDVAFATVGYILTLRPLDSHIRSANPFAAAWMAALMCYPPFILMNDGGPLDYHPGTSDWAYWFQGHPVLLALIGAVLVALTAIYAWATVAFGFRFSNLTNRGILTHGPYAISRHPAYLSKNLFWWISTIPVLTTGSIVDATRATLLLAAVGGVYFWRAKTEERHLKLDPDYRVYFDWMTRNGLVPRLFARIKGKA